MKLLKIQLRLPLREIESKNLPHNSHYRVLHLLPQVKRWKNGDTRRGGDGVHTHTLKYESKPEVHTNHFAEQADPCTPKFPVLKEQLFSNFTKWFIR